MVTYDDNYTYDEDELSAEQARIADAKSFDKNKGPKNRLSKQLMKDFEILRHQDNAKDKLAVNHLKKGMLTKGKHMGADENPPLTEGGLFNTLMSDDPLKGVSDSIAKTLEDNMEHIELSVRNNLKKRRNAGKISNSKHLSDEDKAVMMQAFKLEADFGGQGSESAMNKRMIDSANRSRKMDGPSPF